MKNCYFSLLALFFFFSGGVVIAESLDQSELSHQYPEEFRQEYADECIQTSMGEGLSQQEAENLCDCTITKFQSQYELEEFKQLTINSLQDKEAEAVLVEVGQVCFEEILYEQ